MYRQAYDNSCHCQHFECLDRPRDMGVSILICGGAMFWGHGDDDHDNDDLDNDDDYKTLF